MLLICYIAIRFDNLGASEVVMIVLYSLVLVMLLADLNYNRVPYFKAKKLLNLVLAQRLLLPVLVVLPYATTYQLTVILIGFSTIELVFLAKSAVKTKHYLYSALKLAATVFIGVYVAVEFGKNVEKSS